MSISSSTATEKKFFMGRFKRTGTTNVVEHHKGVVDRLKALSTAFISGPKWKPDSSSVNSSTSLITCQNADSFNIEGLVRHPKFWQHAAAIEGTKDKANCDLLIEQFEASNWAITATQFR